MADKPTKGKAISSPSADKGSVIEATVEDEPSKGRGISRPAVRKEAETDGSKDEPGAIGRSPAGDDSNDGRDPGSPDGDGADVGTEGRGIS
ncbi:MAG: hypothetical protein ACRDT1_15545 [Micromonosporaceae bacterium]